MPDEDRIRGSANQAKGAVKESRQGARRLKT